jgi:hypothetical protein
VLNCLAFAGKDDAGEDVMVQRLAFARSVVVEGVAAHDDPRRRARREGFIESTPDVRGGA